MALTADDYPAVACTATSVMDMLNFIRIRGTGGTGFRWLGSLGAARRATSARLRFQR